MLVWLISFLALLCFLPEFGKGLAKATIIFVLLTSVYVLDIHYNRNELPGMLAEREQLVTALQQSPNDPYLLMEVEEFNNTLARKVEYAQDFVFDWRHSAYYDFIEPISYESGDATS